MSLLFLHELRYYLTTYTVHQVRALFVYFAAHFGFFLVLNVSVRYCFEQLAIRGA